MANLANQPARERIEKLLTDGLPTAWQHRAYTDAQIVKVTTQLQKLAPDDYAGKLKIAGFTAHPFPASEEGDIEQACSSCMYYERNREHCVRPELDLPVKPDWSCVLWRI